MKTIINQISNRITLFNSIGLSLFSGLSGKALFWYEYSKLDKSNSCIKKTLDTIGEKLASEKFMISYSNGLAGVGWLIEYLSNQNYLQEDTNKILEDFDTTLAERLFPKQTSYELDFLHGNTGIAFYFFMRIGKNPKLLPLLADFITYLKDKSVFISDQTITWSTFLFVKQQLVYNLSLSHGMPSMIYLLLKFYSIADIDKELIKELIEKSVLYILQQEIDTNQYHCIFPSYVIPNSNDIVPSRLSWCYGDLGIATTLYQAGKTLNREDWINKSIEILLYAAEKRRDLKENGVFDACLCHGTSGIGHIFYRMWWNTKLPEFKNAADYWFNQTMKMAMFPDGLAGFKTYHQPQYGGWVNVYGLLEGIAGIGLAMMSYYYETEPSWDECLLLS